MPTIRRSSNIYIPMIYLLCLGCSSPDDSLESNSMNTQNLPTVLDQGVVDPPIGNETFADQGLSAQMMMDQFIMDQTSLDSWIMNPLMGDQFMEDSMITDQFVPDQLITDQLITDQFITDQFIADQYISPSPGSEWVTYANQNWDQLKEVSLGVISAGTDCAAFVSAVLRHFGFDVWAVYTDGLAAGDLPEQTLAYRLFELGFQRFNDVTQLQAGDICFSVDAYYEGVEAIACEYEVSQRDGWFPTHTYLFMEWEIPGQTEYAWVVDNQGRRHLRNMTAPGPKDPFQYFMRY